MPTSRHIRATFVLASFIAGIIFAPLSHYAYMAWSDAFVSADVVSHHAGMGHAMPPAPTAPDRATVADDIDVFTCSYWSLFGTFVAVGHAGPPLLFAPVSGCVQDDTPAGEPLPISPSTAYLRGPPIA
jgi:hypothetical protein